MYCRVERAPGDIRTPRSANRVTSLPYTFSLLPNVSTTTALLPTPLPLLPPPLSLSPTLSLLSGTLAWCCCCMLYLCKHRFDLVNKSRKLQCCQCSSTQIMHTFISDLREQGTGVVVGVGALSNAKRLTFEFYGPFGVLPAQRVAASRYAMLAYTLHHVRPIIFCQKITVCNNDRPRVPLARHWRALESQTTRKFVWYFPERC